jgi:hypothetical protein
LVNASQFVEKIKPEFQELALVHLDIIKFMKNADNVVQIVNIQVYIVDAFVMKDLFKLQSDAHQIVPINNIFLMVDALITVNLNFKHLLVEFANAYQVTKE